MANIESMRYTIWPASSQLWSSRTWAIAPIIRLWSRTALKIWLSRTWSGKTRNAIGACAFTAMWEVVPWKSPPASTYQVWIFIFHFLRWQPRHFHLKIRIGRLPDKRHKFPVGSVSLAEPGKEANTGRPRKIGLCSVFGSGWPCLW